MKRFHINRTILRKIYFIVTLSVIAGCIILFLSADKDLAIHFLDVGEGDAIFIKTPHGKSVLIDTGNLVSGFKVARYVDKHTRGSIERLIVTHHNLDHMGGAFFVAQMLNAEYIHDNGQDLSPWTATYETYRWWENLVRKNKHYSVLSIGDSFTIDDVSFRILWPPKNIIHSDINANSLVIMLEYKTFKCLLTGDLITPVEGEFLEINDDIRSDVLKVGHHGYSDANSTEFLKAVSPSVAVISTKEDNPYGFPLPEMIKRFQKLNVNVYRTDHSGDIIITVNKNGTFEVATQHQ